jgi:pimeloyl-ACP methyl ester carboxylesterase
VLNPSSLSRRVTKRLVFYCPGYDPLAETRYRRITGTGLAQLHRRFGIARSIGPLQRDDAVPSIRWHISAGNASWHTETEYEVLRWDDLVQRDFSRGWLMRLPLMFGALIEALRGGVIQKLFRLNWHFAAFVVYPWVAFLVVLLGALVAGEAIAWPIAWALSLPGIAHAALAVALAISLLKLFEPRIKQAFVYHLLDGWIFSWQLAAGRRPEFESRLDNFARRVAAATRDTDAEEVLIVGHSTGTTVAVEVAARALALDPDLARHSPAVALLTIGSCLPVVGFVRTADRLRRQIARLATESALLWVEYQAPQDVLNAFGFDPVRDLGLDLAGAERTNPTIRSARFKETIQPATYRKMRWKFFRMHFHFLMPNDIPGEYDYPMIACGPVSLADRIEDPTAAVCAAYGAQPAAPHRQSQPAAAV